MNKQKIIKFTIANEGGYSNHPADKGGETKYGITKAVWNHYNGIKHLKDITKNDAFAVYDELYYQPQMIDDIVNDYPLLACKFFDSSVNLGRYGATKLLQKMLIKHTNCKIKIDGYIGKNTIRAIKSSSLKDINLVDLFILELKQYYHKIVERKPNQKVFIKGWIRRAEKLPQLHEKTARVK